jgi:uncharacterized protein
MTIAQELLDILACPRCKGMLDYREGEKRLLCPKCRLAYEVRDDIPVMLIEDAKTY